VGGGTKASISNIQHLISNVQVKKIGMLEWWKTGMVGVSNPVNPVNPVKEKIGMME
jgi:hypothetical protein